MGWTREHHNDGTYTDRHPTNDTAVTHNADGTVKEWTHSEAVNYPCTPIEYARVQVTYDGDGNRINIQNKD